MPSRELLVEGRGLTRRFAARDEVVVALNAVDLDARIGALTVVAGPSGSGKSTLLRLVGCLDRPSEGQVHVDGADVAALGTRARRRLRRTAIGLLHSAPAHNLLADLTAARNIATAARLRRCPVDVEHALAAVGLGGYGAALVPELSGGEQLRLGLAVALVGPPRLVVADEPTASLDANAAAGLAELISRLAREDTTFVVASHDHHLVDAADAVVHLEHGRRIA